MCVVGAATTTRSTRPLRSISWATLRPKVVLPAAGVAEARKLAPSCSATACRASRCHARSWRSAGHGGSDLTARRAATPVLTRGILSSCGWTPPGRPFQLSSVGQSAAGGGPFDQRSRKGKRRGGRKRSASGALRSKLRARPRPDLGLVGARRVPRVGLDPPAGAEAPHHLHVRLPSHEGLQVLG